MRNLAIIELDYVTGGTDGYQNTGGDNQESDGSDSNASRGDDGNNLGNPGLPSFETGINAARDSCGSGISSFTYSVGGSNAGSQSASGYGSASGGLGGVSVSAGGSQSSSNSQAGGSSVSFTCK